jgi:hypothetical protein
MPEPPADEVLVPVPVFPAAARDAIDADYADLERRLEEALDYVRQRRRGLAAVFDMARAGAKAMPLAGMFVRIRPEPGQEPAPPALDP